MTKKYAVQSFKIMWDIAVKANPRAETDNYARKVARGDFIDALHKNGLITRRQYETWVYPE